MKRATLNIRNFIRYTIRYALVFALIGSVGSILKAQTNHALFSMDNLVADVSGYVLPGINVSYNGMNMITDFEYERELEIEDWMVDSESWMNSNRILNEATVREEPLEIEDWMTRSLFNSQEEFKEEAVDAEEELKLESWMLQKNGFIHQTACK